MIFWFLIQIKLVFHKQKKPAGFFLKLAFYLRMTFYRVGCFFFLWTIFKVFIEFVKLLFLFYVLVFWPQGMWDLSSPTRGQTCTPALDDEVWTTGPSGKSQG